MSKVLSVVRGIGANRRSVLMVWVAIALFIAIAASAVVFAGYSHEVGKGLADNLIRLHVIANSDSPEDQALKRDVRDAVIDYMKGKLEQSKSIEQTRFIIENNIDEIVEVSERILREKGKEYPVKAMLGSYAFPTRAYGDITLPAGNYQALRIVIGEGIGENWWCVLFPPLCFVDASHGTIPESAKEELRDVLTSEEYRIITSTDSDEDIPIRVRFKVLEFFQSYRLRFNGVMSKIFR